MSVQPLCKKPDELKSFKQKDFKGGFFKFIKKLAQKHTSPETAAPFYLNASEKFSDGDGFIFLAGKIKTWKEHARTAIKTSKATSYRGVCYVTMEGDKYILNLMPVAGACKDAVLTRGMKSCVSASKCEARVTESKLTEAEIEALAEKLDSEKEVELIDEDPNDAESLGDEMQDEIAEAELAAEDAAATGDTKKATAANAKLQEMADDITKLEGLLEKMAASDNAAEVQTLDKEIRTIFAKYQSKK